MKFSIITIAVLMIFNIILLLKIKQIKENYWENVAKQSLLETSMPNYFWKELELESYNSKFELPNISQSHTNDSLFILFYVYSGNECSSCISDEIFAPKAIFNTQSIDNFLITSVTNKTKNDSLKLKGQLGDLRYEIMDKEDVNFPNYGGVENRFFVVRCPNGKLTNFFFPDKQFPKRTELYLEFINQKYLKANPLLAKSNQF